MKKLIARFFDITFWKFILVGILNTIVGTGIMFMFYNLFHFNYWISSSANYIFGSILSYFLNKYFTFKNPQKDKKIILKFIINITICYIAAYGLAKPFVAFLLTGYGKVVQENIAMLMGMCLFVGMNYIGQRFFVFQHKKTEE